MASAPIAAELLLGHLKADALDRAAEVDETLLALMPNNAARQTVLGLTAVVLRALDRLAQLEQRSPVDVLIDLWPSWIPSLGRGLDADEVATVYGLPAWWAERMGALIAVPPGAG